AGSGVFWAKAGDTASRALSPSAAASPVDTTKSRRDMLIMVVSLECECAGPGSSRLKALAARPAPRHRDSGYTLFIPGNIDRRSPAGWGLCRATFMRLTYSRRGKPADYRHFGTDRIGSWSRARTCTPLRHLINSQARLPIPPSRTRGFLAAF